MKYIYMKSYYTFLPPLVANDKHILVMEKKLSFMVPCSPSDRISSLFSPK